MVKGARFTSEFKVDEIIQIGWFKFIEEIMDIILYCMCCSTFSQ